MPAKKLIITICFTPTTPHAIPVDERLARLLKIALRQLGLKCKSVESNFPIPTTTTENDHAEKITSEGGDDDDGRE